jgi:hypothetical protein
MRQLQRLALAFPFAASGIFAAAISMTIAAAQPVQPRVTIPEIMPKTDPAKVGLEPDIAFYVAKGEANACGDGCDTWIAADGKIDIGAAERLRRLLAKLGDRHLPIFFHSPGGFVQSSLELGRFIRSQKLVTGVARTVPRGCDRGNLHDEACEALKRSGSELISEFDTDLTMCSSADPRTRCLRNSKLYTPGAQRECRAVRPRHGYSRRPILGVRL